MADHQHLYIRQGIGFHQLFLGAAGHIAGNEQIKVSGTGQRCQAQLVQIAAGLHRRIDGQNGIAQRIGRLLRHIGHLRALLLRQRHQTLPNAILILDVRQVDRLHRDTAQHLVQTVGVIGVVVGHHHSAQFPDAHAVQRVGGQTAGVFIAVAAAAVHQCRLTAGGQNDALALSHIQRQGGQYAVLIVLTVDPDGRRQRQHRQCRCQQVFPLAVRRGGTADKGRVQKQQPVDEIGIGEIHRVIAPGHHAVGDPQNVPHQRPGDPTQQASQRQPHKAQQHRHKGSHEAPSRRRHRQ